MSIKNVRRIDRTDLKKAEKTSQGFLRAPAYATRTGVFHYRTGDGKVVRELRPPEEVFKADSMATLANVPVTNLHPKPGYLDPVNAKSFTIGFTGDSVEKIDNKFIQVYLTVFDQTTMDQAERGMQEVSCGYTCDHDPSPGIYDGEQYDVIQRNIIYNHLAIVPRGRAGPEVKMRLDADEGEMVNETETKETAMSGKLMINDKEFDASPELVEAHAALMQKNDEAIKDLTLQLDAAKKAKPAEESKEEEESESEEEESDEEKKKKDAAKMLEKNPKGDPSALEAMKKEKDSLKKKNDELEAEIAALRESKTDAMDEITFRGKVNDRMRVLNVAGRLLKGDHNLDEMSDLDIKKAVIKSDNESVDFEGKSDEYVNARFDHIQDAMGKTQAKRDDMGRTLVTNRMDSGTQTPDSEAARKRMMEESKAAYKRPDESKK